MSNEPTIVHTKAGEPVTRVSDRTTGHHYTIPADAFDSARHRPIKAPALDNYGEPAAPKFKAVKDAEAKGDEPESTPDAGEAAQGAEGEPGVYDDTDDHTEQEDQ